MSCSRSSQHPTILFVWYAPFELGGVQTFLANFAGESARRGVRVWIAAIDSNVGPLKALFDQENVAILDWSAFAPAFYRRGGEPREACRRILTDLESKRPDVLMINDCAAFALGCPALLRRLRGFCLIVDTMHTDQRQESYITNRRPYIRYLDGVVATSEEVAARFRRHFPRFDPAAIRYIPYGVPASEGARTDAPDNVLRMLYVGRLDRQQKRVQDLPGILTAIARRGIPLRFSVVGDGPERGALEENFRAAGLADRVAFHGFLPPEQVRRAYLEHDLILSVSDYETGPMTVLEAMQAGCIPVASDIPCIAQRAIRHGENGFLCPVGEAEAFASAVAQATRDPLPRLREEARKTGREFTIPRMVDRYWEFLTELQTRRPVRPWPSDPSMVWGRLVRGWDVSRLNPWIPHPHPIRRMGTAMFRLARRMLGVCGRNDKAATNGVSGTQ